jgi:hypothetical protein
VAKGVLNIAKSQAAGEGDTNHAKPLSECGLHLLVLTILQGERTLVRIFCNLFCQGAEISFDQIIHQLHLSKMQSLKMLIP